MINASWALPGAALLIGAVIGWLIGAAVAHRVANRRRETTVLVAEPDYLRREVSRLRSAEQRLARQLAEKDALVTTTATASQVERDEIHGDLERTREQLDHLRQRLAEVESTGGVAAERATSMAAEKEAELRNANTRAAQVVERAAVEGGRAAKLLAEAETSKALVATETLDLKRRLALTEAAVEQLKAERDAAIAERLRLDAEMVRRDGDNRSRLIAHQAEIARRDTEIGALEAQVARNALLQRRVEDREVLLRSVSGERDQATAANQVGQRDLAAAREQLRRETAARLATEATVRERDARIAALEVTIARLAKQGEDRHGLTTRTAGLIDTLRAEIRDRDGRFQALLNDRRRVVEAGLNEIARLRDQLARVGSHAAPGNGAHPDDLKRITGIGPTLEKLLHELGITTFRQIARWTDDDIERVAAQLGSFRNRVRRDDWVAQARREHEASYGEPP